MDYKIKYNNALEKAKKLYGKYCINNVLEDLFPELAESEDERIRKGIIRNLQYLMDMSEGFVKEDLQEKIVWLENQAEQSTDKIELNLAWSEEDEEMLKWLCRIIHTQRLDRAITLKEESELGEWIDKWLNHNLQTKQSEQSTDKFEPKFKVGDYIVFNGLILHIDEIVNGYYRTTSIGDGIHNSYDWDIDNAARLWTIQDAMDGDVLVNSSNIFVFHFINDTRLMGYCHVNIDDGRFYDDIGKNECFCLVDAIVTPATKEQRNLLFQKMKEAGYEWDAQKKEVKKPTDEIEPKFKPGDFIMNNDITEHGKPEIFKVIKVCSSWYDVENVYDGRQTMITFSQEYICHLWTIDDAKQGDILMVDNEFIVVLYRKITDGTKWKDTSILTEYQYDINDNTFTKGSHLFYCDICPATYTQREVLTNYIQKELNWEK